MNIIMAPYLQKARFDRHKLRMLRGERTQAEVAELIGLTTAAISNLELGLSRPSADTLIRLLLLFNVGVEDITTFDE